MLNKLRKLIRKFSGVKLAAIAFSVLILTLALSQNVFAFGNKYFGLIAGQSTKIKCYAGKLRLVELSKNEWEIKCIGKPEMHPSPTPTPNLQPTLTPTVTINNSPTPTSSTMTHTSGNPSPYWHAVGSHDGLNVHEHGDTPPSWANDFSMSNFGYPVMFGGDEATPNENMMKHQAYKGFLMEAKDTGGTDVYVRYHAASNPHDRAFPVHSYEIYAKDNSGGISFWQGWNFYGYPELRNQRMTRRHEVPGTDGFPGRDQFIIASPDHIDWNNFLRCEQWYGHGGLWAWDVSITICGATTYFNYDEHLTDFANMSTWDKTGSLGGQRRLEISHYGPSNPNVGGLDLPFGKWFCAKLKPNENRAAGTIPTWDITGAVAGANACPSGYLPQFVADSFPKAGVYFQTGNTAEKTFSTQGVTLPN